MLGANSGVRLEQVQSWIGVGLTDNQKRVTGRTWVQLMCCAHLYDMQVCPISSGWLPETRARQMPEMSSEVQRISWGQRMKDNTDKYAIIRLGCIKEDTEFKYRRFGKQEAGAEEDIRERWGE